MMLLMQDGCFGSSCKFGMFPDLSQASTPE